ncbi:MAG: hypothetical protein OEM52_02990 [bacterium]|nr:hypothetical protein [bacterium]
MSMHDYKITTIPNPGPWNVPAKTISMFTGVAAIGAILWGIGLAMDPLRGWSAYIINFCFVFFFALSGVVFTAIQYMTSAQWSPAIRRIPEGMTAFLPLGILFIALYWFGVPKLYEWSDTWTNFHGLSSEVHRTKTTWLSQPFFTVRQIIFAAIWLLFATLMVKNSLKQDKENAPQLSKVNTKLSIAFIIFFALSFSVASYDWLMSLEPTWFSTMFGVYTFTGLFQSGIAVIAIFAILMRRSGALPITKSGHIRDLGGFIFGMSTFMSYIGFSQYMLIWYANLPEETFYFMKRSQEGWWIIFVLLPLLKFVIPFAFLLSADAKRNEKVLLFVAGCVIAGQWLDLYWMVLPAHYAKLTLPGIADVGGLLFFSGLFIVMTLRFYKKHSVLPVGDPGILKSLNWGA